jgi:hypothetical protein
MCEGTTNNAVRNINENGRHRSIVADGDKILIKKGSKKSKILMKKR